MAISPKQRSQFFRAFSAACLSLGLSAKGEQEEYRKTVMGTEGKVSHLADLTQSGLEACMIRFWTDALNWEEAARWGAGTSRRLIWMVTAKAKKIAGEEGYIDYISGVLHQSGIAQNRPVKTLEDLTDPELKKVFVMLETYLRRWKEKRM